MPSSVPAPHNTVSPLPLASARWTEGFWADRFRQCHQVILPRMREALEHPDNSACLSNFRVAAGLQEGGHRGTNWSDGDCYKWLQALAHVYALTGDETLDRELDGWIDLIARSQDEDGYLCTQVQLNPEKERWGARIYHELYNMGHLLTAAAVHQQATGKDTFVAVARKLADYLYTLFQPRPKELAHFGWNPSNIMGLADLYRVTGEPRYLELAGVFVDMRGSVPWPQGHYGQVASADPNPGDQNQDRVALRNETEAVGHAVTATYLWCGATDVCSHTGEEALFEALQRLWRNVVEKKLYVTGAVGAYHHGVSSRGDMVHEAFGREFELPNRTAYNETCANIGNAMWNKRLLDLTGDTRYGDLMEIVLYNSALSPMSLDGTQFCYCNPLARHGAEVPLLHHDTPTRWVTHTCYCCPPQVARTLASVNEWAYGVSAEGLWVHLYGGSEVDADIPGSGRLRLQQQTAYPWEGEVTFTIKEAPAPPFALRLRVPAWATGATLHVNGASAGPALPGTYAAIERTWQAGDTVQLGLPLRPRLLLSNPEVEETRNQVAVMRGPVVYCLESADLPAGVPLTEIALPHDLQLCASFRADLLGGVATLEGKGCRVLAPDWQGRLYRELPATPAEPVDLRLIPYYAWNNRGATEMRVWLPLR